MKDSALTLSIIRLTFFVALIGSYFASPDHPVRWVMWGYALGAACAQGIIIVVDYLEKDIKEG